MTPLYVFPNPLKPITDTVSVYIKTLYIYWAPCHRGLNIHCSPDNGRAGSHSNHWMCSRCLESVQWQLLGDMALNPALLISSSQRRVMVWVQLLTGLFSRFHHYVLSLCHFLAFVFFPPLGLPWLVSSCPWLTLCVFILCLSSVCPRFQSFPCVYSTCFWTFALIFLGPHLT